jgi:hypothetical protein
MGRGEPSPTGGACWGPAVEVCGTPGIVRTGGAHLVVLIPARGSCPCRERRGFRGKEHAGAATSAGRRRDVRTRGERGGGKEEGVADVAFLRACVTEEARASGRALLSGRPGANISRLLCCGLIQGR